MSETGRGPEDVILHEGVHARFVRRGSWEFVERPARFGLVAIAALTDDGRIILVEQWRPPVKARVIELPAGIVGDDASEEDESLLEGARRELIEETGYDATDWTLAACGPMSAGLTTEVLHLWVARGLRKVGEGGGDAHEDIVVHAPRVDEIDAWLETQTRRGALIDLKIHSGLRFLDT